MPTTVNLTKAEPGVNPAVVSVTGWFYAVPWQYPPAPAAMPATPIEVAFSAAHFVVYEGFTAKNGGGQSIGRGSVDTGQQPVTQAFPTAASLEALLAAAFPPPGPN